MFRNIFAVRVCVLCTAVVAMRTFSLCDLKHGRGGRESTVESSREGVKTIARQ